MRLIFYRAAALSFRRGFLMKIHLLLAGVSAFAVFGSNAASAQTQAGSQPQQTVDPAIPTVVVTTDNATATRPFRVGEGVDSGTSTYDDESIQARSAGTGDVLQVLKRSPGVQFSLREGETRGDMLRDLRPSEISISGGRPSENLFVLDGVSVNSQMETMSPSVAYSSAPDFDSVGAASSQTIWVDSDLVGELVLHDSNVSAEFGRFTGGVVEVATRKPTSVFGIRGAYSFTNDDMAHYHLSPSYSGAVREKPAFERERWNVSADLPINDNIGLLAAYSRQEASTFNTWNERIEDVGGETFDETNVSETYLLKYAWDATDALQLSAQVTHSPYNSVYVRTSGINTVADSHGGGTTARFAANGTHDEADWSLSLTYAMSDNDKDAADWRFDVRGGLEPWCIGALTVSCENGHTGAIQQSQEDTSIKGTWNQPLLDGELRTGFEVTDVTAAKSRRDSGVYSFTGTTAVITNATGPLTSCGLANDVSCFEGRYAYNQKQLYQAYDVEVSLQSYGAWVEYQTEWNGFDVRTGLRYDHESFLGNHTLAPRLSVSRELPWASIQATAGLNRYYGRSYLGYAMRENLPNQLRYGRTFSTVNGRRVWGDWVLNFVTLPQAYSSQDLDSPYTDEASLNLTGDLLGGQWRIGGVYREGKDLFARSVAETFTLVDELGATRTYNRYNMTNGGESTYSGVDLSYVVPWKNHTFSFSTNWSDTKYSADSYYDSIDDDVAGTTLVAYQGEVTSLSDLLNENQRQNFATPFLLNLDWDSKWFDGRLGVNLGGRFRGEFERIEQTADFLTIGGTRYRVYDIVEYKNSFDLDANLTYALVRGDYDVTLEARISNVLDKIPDRNAGYSSTPWQLGRSAWFGIRVKH